MDIGVFGATGVIGRAVVAEAGQRGHRVTAFTRNPARIPAADEGETRWKVVDLTDTESAAQALTGLDVAVNAINSGDDIPGQIAHADALPATARVLLKALECTPATRLLVVGGGGSLEIAPGVRLIDDEQLLDTTMTDVLGVPREYRTVVRAHSAVLDLCRLSNRYWTYLSPSAGRIDSGARTGRYRTGGDAMLPPGDDPRDISAEDLAVALLDEAEIPRHIQRRFTVARA
ncbi:NAD(P)H-binding protein [Streptomyces sp. N2-109]|uniref:NAD(P)H-binding protein n=1 Tax=Streptomyces gossypii TaxID=2883101 RepID=A0ABT2JNT8_9ACTN|nr:NAD(P)H-binding protein [Streptomyces gossypii]MCT2589535.1 NAD(P)H-binding protein [Streptomyces gossypii]